jgi:hypothetical protein
MNSQRDYSVSLIRSGWLSHLLCDRHGFNRTLKHQISTSPAIVFRFSSSMKFSPLQSTENVRFNHGPLEDPIDPEYESGSSLLINKISSSSKI